MPSNETLACPATRAEFPSTPWTLLCRSGRAPMDTGERRLSLETLAQHYWKPVYAYFRLRWSQDREEAIDMTQEFFLWILERPFTEHLDPSRGRFRAFVRACIDNFKHNVWRKAHRQRRGGGTPVLSLDFGEDADAFLGASLPGSRTDAEPHEILDLQWKRAILERAISLLETWSHQHGKPEVFEVFRRYDLAESAAERPTYEELARHFGRRKSDIDNLLSLARRQLVGFVRQIVAESVDSPEALEEEMELFRQA